MATPLPLWDFFWRCSGVNGETESLIGGTWWLPPGYSAIPPSTSCCKPCPSGPDSRQAGRIFRYLGGLGESGQGEGPCRFLHPSRLSGDRDPVVLQGPQPSSQALPGKRRGFPPASCLPLRHAGAAPGSHSSLERGALRLPVHLVGGPSVGSRGVTLALPTPCSPSGSV